MRGRNLNKSLSQVTRSYPCDTLRVTAVPDRGQRGVEAEVVDGTQKEQNRLRLLARMVQRHRIHPAEFPRAVAAVHAIRAHIHPRPARMHTQPEALKRLVPICALVPECQKLRSWFWNAISRTLMVAFYVIVRDVMGRTLKRGSAEEDRPIAFRTARSCTGARASVAGIE